MSAGSSFCCRAPQAKAKARYLKKTPALQAAFKTTDFETLLQIHPVKNPTLNAT
jgi:hypothetical protein